MNKFLLTCFAFLSLTLSACAISTDKTPDTPHQSQVISRWHQCLERSYRSLDTGTNSPTAIIEDAQIVCQGHKRDVLATFPEKLEKSLEKRMKTIAYESGLDIISDARGVGESVTTSFQRIVTSQKQP